MSDLDELYQSVILDHNKSPRNFRKLADASAHAEGRNPLCGDVYDVWVRLDGDVIQDVSFEGQGCAISKASASMMTQAIKGKTIAEARALFDRFHEVVTGLWDSFADDAFVREVDSGIYFDPDKMHVLNHKGKYFSVRGPLNIARPVQGWPVIVQAGASDAGRQLAAETAEVVFAAGSHMANAQRFYADVKSRMKKAGRDPDHLKILPGALVVVGDSVGEAREKRALLDSRVHYANAIASLSIALGHDASGFDPDGPLPEIPETNASKSGRERVIELAKREHLTVRQLAQRLGGYGGLAFVGTPASIADQMEEWLVSEASDGFNVMFPYLPEGLDDFVDSVVPELQRRGIFRREYEGKTLRENLGLPRPENRYFPRVR